MEIGRRLRELREVKQFSQGDIERRTGLLRCYISRVENGYTIPSIETLEKFARALEVPIYQFFIGGDEKPNRVPRVLLETGKERSFGNRPKERRYLIKLWHLLEKINKSNRALLLSTAQAMVRRNA
jgi:transcriptional regulator with XRE-family HTH domain